jgi:hypothetical protein
VCNKQYTTAMELEEHLSSYDHHHKKVTAAQQLQQMLHLQPRFDSTRAAAIAAPVAAAK